MVAEYPEEIKDNRGTTICLGDKVIYNWMGHMKHMQGEWHRIFLAKSSNLLS